MDPQFEDTVVAKRSSNNSVLNSLSIINFKLQFEIIRPSMSPRGIAEIRPVNSATVFGHKMLDMASNAVSTSIKSQDQNIEKLRNLNLRSVVPAQAVEKAHAMWDKLNLKEWMKLKMDTFQMRPVKPSMSMLSKAMIFLCLLPFLTVLMLSIVSLLVGVFGLIIFEGSMLTILSAVIGGILLPSIAFVCLFSGVVFAIYHFGGTTVKEMKTRYAQFQQKNSSPVEKALPETMEESKPEEEDVETKPEVPLVERSLEHFSRIEAFQGNDLNNKRRVRKNYTKNNELFQLSSVMPPCRR